MLTGIEVAIEIKFQLTISEDGQDEKESLREKSRQQSAISLQQVLKADS
jgi:hypothetical protein